MSLPCQWCKSGVMTPGLKLNEIMGNEESNDDALSMILLKKLPQVRQLKALTRLCNGAGNAMVDQSHMSVLRRLREKVIREKKKKRAQQDNG